MTKWKLLPYVVLGCMYDLRAKYGPGAAKFLYKIWQFASNIKFLGSNLQTECFYQKGEHVTFRGQATRLTENYPVTLARKIHDLFAHLSSDTIILDVVHTVPLCFLATCAFPMAPKRDAGTGQGRKQRGGGEGNSHESARATKCS